MESWISVCGEDGTQLASDLERSVAAHRTSGAYTMDNQYYIRDVSLAISRGEDFFLSERRLELLRQLCSLHKIVLHAGPISSHRPFVGKFIVFGKKLAFRFLKPLLEPVLRQQSTFNAATIYLLAQVANEAKDLQRDSATPVK